MTFGQFAVGLGVFLMLLQFYLIAQTRKSGGVSGPMLVVMLSMAIFTPLLAYFTFYQFWPELGTKVLSG